MARPYAQEMARLAQSLAWATATPVEELTRAVTTAALGSLVAVGSGGSLSAAHFLAQLHQRQSGELARTAIAHVESRRYEGARLPVDAKYELISVWIAGECYGIPSVAVAKADSV